MPVAQRARVDLREIVEPAHQLRAEIEAGPLGELADSMAAEGLLQPIGLRGPRVDGTYEIVWGHRRFLAAKLLRWEEIDAQLFPADYDPIVAAVAENEMRVDLSPIEQARVVRRMIEAGHAEASVARLFRHTLHWVQVRLDLLAMPDELQSAVHERRLSMSVARVLADVDHADYRQALIAEAERTGASAPAAEVWRAHYLADRERIIHNRETVEAIAASREKWKILVPCDACGTDKEYAQTRTLRLCIGCADELEKAIAEAATPA